MKFLACAVLILGATLSAYADTPLNSWENTTLTAVSEGITAGKSASQMQAFAMAYVNKGQQGTGQQWQNDLISAWGQYTTHGGTAAAGLNDWLGSIGDFYSQVAPPTSGAGASTDSVRARGRSGAF